MKNNNDDKKEQLLYRIVRICFIFAVVVLVGLNATNYSKSTIEQAEHTVESADNVNSASTTDYRFRNEDLLVQHYEKHGIEMGFASKEEYEAAASRVVNDSRALHKLEAEDGDDVYYIEETNEFVIVSKDGYIRTYLNPDSGKKYFDKQ